LNARGEKAATLVGAYLAKHHAHIDLVLCSTAVRAVETRKRVIRVGGLVQDTLVEGQPRQLPIDEAFRSVWLDTDRIEFLELRHVDL
jgi:phosphohistidine phosphatase SixA